MGKIKKIVSEKIVPKTGIFIFVMVFVSLFSNIFGFQNALIGVAVVIAIIMYKDMDIGISPIQSSIMLPILFILTGCFTQIASYNPLLGIFINFLGIPLILILVSCNHSCKSYMPLLLCYVFCNGNIAYGEDVIMRMAALITGGIIVGVSYFFFNRKKRNMKILDYLKSLQWTDKIVIYVLKMSIGLTIAMLVADLADLQKGLWIVITVMSVTQMEHDMTKTRIKKRLLGTIIGSFLFILLFQVLIPEAYIFILVLILNYIYNFIEDYFIQIIFITMNSINGAIMLMAPDESLPMRLTLIASGAVIGGVISILVHKVGVFLLNRREEA